MNSLDTLSSISTKTRETIRNHITISEESKQFPYLDPKGNVTIGIGFKINSEDEFAKLDLHVLRNGKHIPATEVEKREAYQQLQKEKESLKGNLNRGADYYKEKTGVSMPQPVQDAEFDKRAGEKIDGIKKSVSDEAWNKLNDQQKAAVTDIAYANGSLDKFPKLKEAIREGDARKMADESTFYTDSKKGTRHIERLERNYEALSGLDPEESKSNLRDLLKHLDADKRSDTPDESRTPGNDGTPGSDPKTYGPGSKDNSSNDGDGDKEGNGKGGGTGGTAAGDTAGNTAGGNAMSARLENEPDDPAGGTLYPQLRGGPNDTDDNDFRNVKPVSSGPRSWTDDQHRLYSAFKETDGPLGEIPFKKPEDLTADEARALQSARIRMSPGPERDRLVAMERAFFENAYSKEPARLDASGRIVPPEPRRPLNGEPVAATSVSGEKLDDAIQRIASKITDGAAETGTTVAVRDLQAGLNFLIGHAGHIGTGGFGRNPSFGPEPGAVDPRFTPPSQRERTPDRRDPLPNEHGGRTMPYRPEEDDPANRYELARTAAGSGATPHSALLKIDGDLGRKTRGALRQMTATMGPGRVEEGLALARFSRFARDVHTGRADTDGLQDALATSVSPLFAPGTNDGGAKGHATAGIETRALQRAINEIGLSRMGPARYEQLDEDGIIGPKTQSAFRFALGSSGPDTLVRGLGRALGFL